jgi:hypothetical protein
MATAAIVTTGTVWQGNPARLMRRVVGINNQDLTQASVSSIAYKTFEDTAGDPYAVVASGSLTVATVIFDTRQTESWTQDELGYNFRWDSPGALYPKGNTVYRVEVTLTPTTGDAFAMVFKVTAKDLKGV